MQDGISLLSRGVIDAHRFVLSNRRMIEEAPLQVYLSALAFAPTRSVIRQAYKFELPRWLTQLPKMQDDWGQEWFTLEEHSDNVAAVAFSPRKRLFASGSGDTTVRL